MIGPVFEQHEQLGLGELILAAVEATRSVVSTNTNLGLILLMAPLAKASTLDQAGIQAVLSNLNSDDADLTYQAIAKANAGGLGEVEGMDVRGQAPDSLLEAMNCAKERDLIAAQYTNQFDDVLSVAAPKLRHSQDLGLTQPNAIVRTHVELMSLYPDSLIARKCGIEVANESASRAAAVLAQASSGQEGVCGGTIRFGFFGCGQMVTEEIPALRRISSELQFL